MIYMTYVVEYKENENPEQLLGKPALGGTVIAMASGDETVVSDMLREELESKE